MLRVIYGEKGAGKTKRILDESNGLLSTAKGTIVFIDDDKSNSRQINYQIRFIDASEYSIDSPKMFYGFICGIAAQDFDLEAIYIDGFRKIVRHDLKSLEDLFISLEKFSEKFNITITIAISAQYDKAPAFLEKYIV